ncbi:MAG: CobD/CbiB family cobalamin biosynthesis protein [Halobacteriales archaeon]
MPLSAVLAVGLAAALDYAIEEFPRPVHPVAIFGCVLEPLDRSWRFPRVAGAVGVVSAAAVAAGLAAGLVAVARGIDPLLGGLVAGVVMFSTTSLRMLLRTAREAIKSSEGDPRAARDSLPALVGRDPDALSPAEIRSAAVESAAENLSDALVAPLAAFAAFAPLSLPLAAGATAFLKAVNTADSMLGYRSKPVGWAAARLDDAFMWLPARLTAVAIAFAALDPATLARARPEAAAPPSPNSGWPMATLAAVLPARFSKPGAYDLFPESDLPSPAAAMEGIGVVARAGALSILVAGVIAWS